MPRTVRLQLRLLTCHLGGAAAASAAIPYLLAAGLDLRNVVLAWVAGVVLFLLLALAAGFVWRRSIAARPVPWAVAAPAAVAAAIFALLWARSGFAPEDARLALEPGLVGGLCAVFSSLLFLVWTSAASGPADTP